ncbi:hypothetical protein PI125_g18238 [Phytophthora idaei]|nr:hypothetical protein PI125_g18238 [Phytophthora idaei]
MCSIGCISALSSNSNNERYSVSSEHSVRTAHHGAAHYSRHGRRIAYGFRGAPSHADRSIAEDGVVPRWRDQDSRTGLIYENEDAGVPMTMFVTDPIDSDGWVVMHDEHSVNVHRLAPRCSKRTEVSTQVGEMEISSTVLATVKAWTSDKPQRSTWDHIKLYVSTSCEVRLVAKMYSRAQAGQQHVRSLELAQSSGRLKRSVNRERFRTIAKQTNRLRRAAINDSTLATYAEKFRHWTKYL